MRHTKKLLAILIAGSMGYGTAYATNGYSPHGIGLSSKGMGGVYIGYQGDSVALGGNPAGSAFMDNRLDIGIDFFKPDRSAEINNSFHPMAGAGFSDGDFDGNESSLFAIPEFGYVRSINNQWTAGLSLFGNGGMNTDYKDGIPAFNTQPNERTGINLAQLFIVPSASFKFNDSHAIGVGLNLVAQSFEAKGLTGFTNDGTNPFLPVASNAPDKVTDNDADWAYGAGIRVGYSGKIGDMVTIGATYQSRTYMGEFDDYAGLFAEQGDFDVPSNYGIGIAFAPMDNLVIAADVMRINYSEIDSISNTSNDLIMNCPGFGAGGTDTSYCMGGDNGPGFGWEDMTVYKLAIEYAVNKNLVLRGGYNYGKQPIPEDETVFNILAPAVVEHHYTLGATWGFSEDMALTFAYMHAVENTVEGDSSMLLGGGTADITMSQDSFGVGLNWKL